MKISPELIPHSEFHKMRWLQSVERPSWYYFNKVKANHSITNKNFLNTVDEPLKELVDNLHQLGIKTTPSCSGHHINERNLEKIFANLEEDAAIIHKKGLNLLDVESGELQLYHDKNYTLPWVKDDFVRELSHYQHKGVLGLRAGDGNLKDDLLQLRLDGVRVNEENNIIFVFTNEENQYDIRSIWNKITKEIIEILNGHKY